MDFESRGGIRRERQTSQRQDTGESDLRECRESALGRAADACWSVRVLWEFGVEEMEEW